jgi:hypothetical protein
MKLLQLLNTSKRWCKGYLAKTENGIPTMPNNSDAVKWCLIGAVQKCYGDHRCENVEEKIKEAIRSEFPKITFSDWNTIVEFNNAPTTSFRKLRRVLKKANV